MQRQFMTLVARQNDMILACLAGAAESLRKTCLAIGFLEEGSETQSLGVGRFLRHSKRLTFSQYFPLSEAVVASLS